ncbi:1-acyl-sn-glycerol-3-phosphate acyltransferase [Candidatus Saccharibacteria bacterium]|nr:1-acyl-sn-glycerol-3-phosphate acyltransferase [Candidatus Saccharibacteria bacterium]
MTENRQHSTWRYRSPVHGIFRSAAYLLLLKPSIWSVLSVKVHGRRNLRQLKSGKSYIVIANHASHFDAPLVLGALPQRLSRRIATAAAADNFFRQWHKQLPTRLFFNTFPVDRQRGRGDEKYKGLASELLNRGVPLLIFPEGTRSRSGLIDEFKIGSAKLACQFQIPVVPIALIGTFDAWPAQEKIWKSGRLPVDVVFGEPLVPEKSETPEEFNRRLRDTIIELYDKTEKRGK